MRNINTGHFYNKVHNKKEHYPSTGLIELTYRCSLNCIHCYCKCSKDKERELATAEWKKILDEIQKEGCLWLTLSGGDPLLRDDFLEIYAYAKKKGFIINLFTDGQRFRDEIIDYLVEFPPYSIEITLNGITKNTYESITQVEGSFFKVMETIHVLAEKKLPLQLKANCLKQNKNEIGKIKIFTDELLGKSSENRHHFMYDTMVYPRLNGDRIPCHYRLSFEEMLDVKKQDLDIWQEHQKGRRSHRDFPDLGTDKDALYRCNIWMSQFSINPYGRLKFCQFSDKFSVDLRKDSFNKGFYDVFPQILKEKFKTDSKCQNCDLRPICYNCPIRAYLETGDEEAPVPYYCELAKVRHRELIVSRNMPYVSPPMRK